MKTNNTPPSKEENGLNLKEIYTESPDVLKAQSSNWKMITDSPDLLKWADALYFKSEFEDANAKVVFTHSKATMNEESDANNKTIYRLDYTPGENLLEKNVLEKNERYGLSLPIIEEELNIPEAIKNLIAQAKKVPVTPELLFVQTHVSQNVIKELIKIQAAKMAWYNVFGTDLELVAFVQPIANKDAEENNLVRSTLALTAAVMASANYIYVPPISPKLHGEYASELALKQQIILKQESHMDFYTTPLKGSHMVETIVADVLEML